MKRLLTPLLVLLLCAVLARGMLWGHRFPQAQEMCW